MRKALVTGASRGIGYAIAKKLAQNGDKVVITGRNRETLELVSQELGKKPVKIEYANSFEDEDGIRCIIFKYKKNILGKWLLGIVSESGTFSEMKEYNQKSEIEDAKQILKMLKNYWKEMSKKMQ